MKTLFFSLLISGPVMANLHPDFVSLSDACPGIIIQSNYATADNFTGEIVHGYKAQKAFMAKLPASILCEIHKDALEKGYSLKIFDSYRPVKAVQFFQDWAKRPETNPVIKKMYYPKFSRLELFDRGYIAKQSSHSRGSAVDLTLVDMKNGKELDMGSIFDYFDDLSNTDSNRITKEQRKNRMLLKDLMESRGFKNFSQEWWHYSYRPEPFPETSFDFDVE